MQEINKSLNLFQTWRCTYKYTWKHIILTLTLPSWIPKIFFQIVLVVVLLQIVLRLCSCSTRTAILKSVSMCPFKWFLMSFCILIPFLHRLQFYPALGLTFLQYLPLSLNMISYNWICEMAYEYCSVGPVPENQNWSRLNN